MNGFIVVNVKKRRTVLFENVTILLNKQIHN